MTGNGNVLNFPRHHWARCENPECGGCYLCNGGLAVCTRCGGAEGSLPTDCPGEEVDVQRGMVFSTETLAEAFCARMKDRPRTQRGPGIHWRVYRFILDKEETD